MFIIQAIGLPVNCTENRNERFRNRYRYSDKKSSTLFIHEIHAENHNVVARHIITGTKVT
jgi:hypothetical protein